MSLSFWMCLLLAVALFALVVLSPKVVRGSRRAEEYAINQQRLINLRQEIEYGESLAHEMESNTALGASLAVLPHAGAAPAQGERIAVAEPLRYHGRPKEMPSAQLSDEGTFRVRVLRTVAGSRLLQSTGLVGSAALLILAFAVLTERPVTDGGGYRRSTGPHRASRGRRLPSRYAVPAASESPTSEVPAE